MPDPESGFDKDGYLKQQGFGNSTDFIAQVLSHRTKLTGINHSPCGKKLVLQYTMTFTSDDFPWIKIVHTIPRKKYHEAQIFNLTAENNTIKGMLPEIKEEVQKLLETVKELKEEVASLEKEIAEQKVQISGRG